MKSFLRIAGRNGALVVIFGVLIGLGLPTLSNSTRPLLAGAIFVFTFGSFLKVDSRNFIAEASDMRRNVLIALWATFGVPAVIFVMIGITHPDRELSQGLLFWALVPASPACVAFAAILRLNAVISLLATVIGTAMAPLYIPLLASLLGGYRLDFDPVGTSFELVVVVGGAFLASLAVKRLAAPFIAANPEVVTGIAVCAMFVAGMGAMKGMQAHILLQPALSLRFVVFAYALLFGFEILGSLLFWRYGRTAAFTAGLVSGTRTITLAWVVLGDKILPMADLFLAASMIAKYTAPGLTKWLLSRVMVANGAFAPARQRLMP